MIVQFKPYSLQVVIWILDFLCDEMVDMRDSKSCAIHVLVRLRSKVLCDKLIIDFVTIKLSLGWPLKVNVNFTFNAHFLYEFFLLGML
jgi:hypothetical protein